MIMVKGIYADSEKDFNFQGLSNLKYKFIRIFKILTAL